MRRSLLVFPFVAALGACAVPVRYAPIGPPAQHLPTSRLPGLSLDEVSDQSGRGELFIHHVGGVVNEFPDDPGVAWEPALRDALTLELQRIGWPAAADGAKVRLKAALVKTRADWNAGIGVKVDGKIRIELVLQDAAGREIWRGGLDGAGSGTAAGGGGPDNGIREAWCAALNDAISRLGPLLAKDRPWEARGGSPEAVSSAAAEKPWWSKGQ